MKLFLSTKDSLDRVSLSDPARIVIEAAFRKLICIDGKAMRSNKRKEGKPSHIVSAWSREDGF